MGVSRSSLSHAVKGLERDLDVRLLHRTTRSVAPTEAGARRLSRGAPPMRDRDGMLAPVSGDGEGLAGVLRINANEAAARWLLRHVAPGFLNRHSRVTLDLVSEGRLVDIVAGGFDAGVRLREAVPQDMIAVPFGGEVRFLAVAAAAYLSRHGEPRSPEDENVEAGLERSVGRAQGCIGSGDLSLDLCQALGC